ncbi:uncharacterized protein FFMR_11308 [Fusarium fujikuroi]|nr:uncharacterized protein FFM5_07910 [Fusarium fujikuroi]SCO52989.1 uncharacterized protein FFMR_11308 [Fusarium fujikuroi]
MAKPFRPDPTYVGPQASLAKQKGIRDVIID